MANNSSAGSSVGRRQFLRSGAAFVVGGLAGGFLGRIGEGAYNTIFPQETQTQIDKSYLSSLFDITVRPPSVYGGNGNILGRAIGLKDISPYLRYSSATLVDFITNALEIDRNLLNDNGDESFEYNPIEQAVFLGSPVSNPVGRYIMGYKIGRAPDGVPEINYEDVQTRWAFLFGETGFGVYGGQRQVAGRYSESRSELVQRPIYKLVDKADGRIITPSINGGMIANEWLTIIRRKDRDRYKTLIAGMHGSGTKSFFADFRRNISRLHRLTEAVDQYQLIVPVDLDHTAGLDGVRRTTGEIDWSRARLHIIA